MREMISRPAGWVCSGSPAFGLYALVEFTSWLLHWAVFVYLFFFLGGGGGELHLFSRPMLPDSSRGCYYGGGGMSHCMG